MNAILLAAGVGKRLRPITDLMPKALLPVVNKPIIEINIERLIASGAEKIYINLFHKPEMIKTFLEKFSDVVHIAVEPQLRGTGGALLNFKDFLKEDFIIYSCDVISNVNFEDIKKLHGSHKAMATLILLKNEGTNFIKIDENNVVKEISKTTHSNESNYYTFSGISVFSEKVFSYLPQTEYFSMIDVLQNIINNGDVIMGFPKEMMWFNINSDYAYWKIHDDILRGRVQLNGIKIESSVYIDPSSDVQTKNLDGFVSIGADCYISDKVSLRNTVVFYDSSITDGDFSNCLLSDRFCIQIDERGI